MININEDLREVLQSRPNLNQFWVTVLSQDDKVLKVLAPSDILKNSKLNKTSSANSSLDVGGFYAGILDLSITAEAYRSNPLVFKRYNKLKVVQYFWFEGINRDDYRRNTDGTLSTNNFVVLGTYHINSCECNDYVFNIEAYDCAYAFDKKMSDSDNADLRGTSRTVSQLLSWACNKVTGLGYKPTLGSIPNINNSISLRLSEDSSYETYRDLISDVAFILGGFACIGYFDDILSIKQYDTNTIPTGLSHIRLIDYSLDIEDSRVGIFRGTCCGYTYDYTSAISGANLTIATEESKLLRGIMPYNSKQLTNEVVSIYDNIRGIFIGKTFRGCEMTFTSFPIVELGDNLSQTRVYSHQGVLITETVDNILVTEVEHSFNGRTIINSPTVSHTEVNDNYKLSSSPKTRGDSTGEPDFNTFVDGITGVHYTEYIKYCPITIDSTNNTVERSVDYGEEGHVLYNVAHALSYELQEYFRDNFVGNRLYVDYSGLSSDETIVSTSIDLANTSIQLQQGTYVKSNLKQGMPVVDDTSPHEGVYDNRCVTPFVGGNPLDISLDTYKDNEKTDTFKLSEGINLYTKELSLSEITDYRFTWADEFKTWITSARLSKYRVKSEFHSQIGITQGGSTTYTDASDYIYTDGRVDSVNIVFMKSHSYDIYAWHPNAVTFVSESLSGDSVENVEDLAIYLLGSYSTNVAVNRKYTQGITNLDYKYKEIIKNVPQYAEVVVSKASTIDSSIQGAIDRVNEASDLVPAFNALSENVGKVNKSLSKISGDTEVNTEKIKYIGDNLEVVTNEVIENKDNTKVNTDNIELILSDYLKKADYDYILERLKAIEDYIGMTALEVEFTGAWYSNENNDLLSQSRYSEALGIYFINAYYFDKLKFRWASNKDGVLFTLNYRVVSGNVYAVSNYTNVTLLETGFDVSMGSNTNTYDKGYTREFFVDAVFGTQSATCTRLIKVAQAPLITKTSFTATRSGDVVTIKIVLAGGFPAIYNAVPDGVPVNPEGKFKYKYSLSTSSSTSATKYKVLDDDYVWDKDNFTISFSENKPSTSATSYYLHVTYSDGFIAYNAYVQVK